MDRYLVFARSAYAEPLAFRGALEVPAGASPGQPARETYGSAWVELVLIPEQDVTWVIEETLTTSVEDQP